MEERAINLPGVSVWCSLSSSGLIWPSFFEATVTSPAYLPMMQGNTIPLIKNLFLEKERYFQQDGAPPHYHNNVRNFHNVCFPGRWIRHRGRVEYLPRTPAKTHLDFYFWGTLNNTVYTEKPRTVQGLSHEIEIATIPLQTIQEVCDCCMLMSTMR
jgi:hypothetical protein